MNDTESYSPVEIRQQLTRIIKNAEFSASKLLSSFLEFVVEEVLAGRSEYIKEYPIATNALNRPKSFNPQIDPVVRIHAGRLRRALHQYYRGPGANDPIRIEIPKGTYVPIFETNVAERDHAVIKSSASASLHSDTIKSPNSKMIIVAVLPFRQMKDNAPQDFLAEGLGEQICTELTRFKDLSVIAYYSSRKFAGATKNLKQVRRDLGADITLTGSVRRFENSLRVNVQLHNTETYELIWANVYDRDLTAANLFEIEDDIVRNIIGAIAGTHGAIIRRLSSASQEKSPQDMTVYDAIFMHYHYTTVLTEESQRKAFLALKQALEIEPERAELWAKLGEIYLDNYVMGYGDLESPLENGLRCTHKALAINRNNQHANAVQAWAYLLTRNGEEATRAAERCLALNPNSAYHASIMGWVIICCGEYERGREVLEGSFRLNPYYPGYINSGISIYHYQRGDYRQALAAAEKMNTPALAWDPLLRSAALGQLGKKTDARKALEELLQLKPDFAEQAREYISSLLYPEDLVEAILQGLQRAGLDIELHSISS